MGQFIVSARKYRPQKWEDVVGQEHVTTTLQNAIKNDHLAQSFLFCGPRGVGKTTCARILAKAVNIGTEGYTDETEDFSFNIFELDAASNNSVDDVRMLVDQVRIPPQKGQYKVYIIDEVHMLSQAAFNAFLKTLEEPPPYAIFILATTEKHKIIPTILSRCQIFDFRRISVEEIVSHLRAICEQENIDAEDDGLHIIAQKADGALRDALSMFDRLVSFSGDKLTYESVLTTLNVLDYDYFFKVTDALLAQDTATAMLLFDKIQANGFDGDDFMLGLSEHFRNLLVCQDVETVKLLEVSDNLKERYHNQAALAPPSFLVNALNIANECDVNYKMSKNKRLLVELSLIKMCYISAAIDFDAGKITAVPTPKATPAVKPATETTESTPEASEGSSSTPSNEEEDDDAKKKTHSSELGALEEPAAEEKPAPVQQKPQEQVYRSPIEKDEVEIKKTSKLPSLEDLAKEVEAGDAADEQNGQASQAAKGEQKDIEPDAFFKAWDTYARKMDDEGRKGIHNLMTSIKPELQGTQVTLKVASRTQKELLVNERVELVEYFMQHLNIADIAFNFEVEQSDDQPLKKVAFTMKEKYERLVEQNPKVKDLKDRLGLELEY